MSSKMTKHNKGPRCFYHPPQKPDEHKGVSFSHKLGLWVIYHHYKTPNKTDEIKYLTESEYKLLNKI